MCIQYLKIMCIYLHVCVCKWMCVSICVNDRRQFQVNITYFILRQGPRLADNTSFYSFKWTDNFIFLGQTKHHSWNDMGLWVLPTGLPKLVVTFPVSLAFLCDLKRAEDSCEVSSHTYLQCDLTVAMGTERLPGSWPYLYLCDESSQCLLAPDRREPAFPSFSGLFLR